ncbi:unnamed protein product [Prunus armeniaca]
MAVSDVNRLDSCSCDEVDMPMRKRKRKLPEKAVRNYSVFNRRKMIICMVHPIASQDLWAKTNFPPLLPPKYHKQPRRPKKRKVPLKRQNKRAPQGNTSTQRVMRQSRQKQASSSTQSRQKQPIISKAKKRTNHHHASSQSNQAPQPSHQAAQQSQPSQASQFDNHLSFNNHLSLKNQIGLSLKHLSVHKLLNK